MYFPYFMAYMGIGLAIGVGVFAWALKNGQFKDQQRARFLPLEDDPAPVAGTLKAFRRLEFWVLGGLALAGLGTSAAVLIFSLLKG